MLEVYGIDTEDVDLMSSRSWRWLKGKIVGLLDRTPTFVAYGMDHLAVVPSTRLGFVLNPPNFE